MHIATRIVTIICLNSRLEKVYFVTLQLLINNSALLGANIKMSMIYKFRSYSSSSIVYRILFDYLDDILMQYALVAAFSVPIMTSLVS